MPSWAGEADSDSGIASFLQTGAEALNEHYTQLSTSEKKVIKASAKGFWDSLK